MKLTLANDVLASFGSFEGYYKPSSVVNGKHSFKSGGNAIWNYNNFWIIGGISNLGDIAYCVIFEDAVQQKIVPG